MRKKWKRREFKLFFHIELKKEELNKKKKVLKHFFQNLKVFVIILLKLNLNLYIVIMILGFKI